MEQNKKNYRELWKVITCIKRTYNENNQQKIKEVDLVFEVSPLETKQTITSGSWVLSCTG